MDSIRKESSKTGYTLFIHLAFWVYLLVGSLLYFVIEAPSYRLSKSQTITINTTFCQSLVNAVQSNLLYEDNRFPMWIGNETNQLIYWSTVLKETCGGLTFANTSSSSKVEDPSWEYSSALFLCMSLLTTIGYGDFSPKTDGGKVFVIFYGFIGIPICGLCLATTSNYFSNAFLRLYNRYPKLQKKTKHSIFVASIVFLLPGVTVFYLIPSMIFAVIEDWDYLDATYFGFITLSTIGFGDIVPAMETGASWLWIYRVCWVIWVSLGIAYWAIIIGFITKALKSKELKRRWLRTSDAISKQAMEVRRAMSVNSKDRDPNQGSKSKSAFDFAFQLGSSINSLRGKRKLGRRRGMLSEINFSAPAVLGQLHYLQQDQLDSAGDNADTRNTTDGHFDRSMPVNSHNSSSTTDSGFDDDGIAEHDNRPTDITAADRPRGLSFISITSTGSRSPSMFSVASNKTQKEDTTDNENKWKHLKTVPENVSPPQNLQVYSYRPNMIWQTFGVLKNTWAWGAISNLGRNIQKVLEWGTPRFMSPQKQQAASPEMDIHSDQSKAANSSQQLQDLLMEAMLILQEADLEGLNPDEE